MLQICIINNKRNNKQKKKEKDITKPIIISLKEIHIFDILSFTQYKLKLRTKKFVEFM